MRAVRRRVAYYEYVGRTGMTALGAATGKRYRFDGSGTVVAVDPRDEPALSTVPHLRKLRSRRVGGTPRV